MFSFKNMSHLLYFEFVIAGVVRVKNLHLRKCSKLVNPPLSFLKNYIFLLEVR